MIHTITVGGLRFDSFHFICDLKDDEIIARTYSGTCFLDWLTYIANYLSFADFSARYTGSSRVPPRSTNNISVGFPRIGALSLAVAQQHHFQFLGGFPLLSHGFGPHLLIQHSRSLRCLGETVPFKSILTRRELE